MVKTGIWSVVYLRIVLRRNGGWGGDGVKSSDEEWLDSDFASSDDFASETEELDFASEPEKHHQQKTLFYRIKTKNV